MIRMNRRMQGRAIEETDLLVDLTDPSGLLGLRVLVDAARAGDGKVRVREHDILVLVERVRQRSNGNGNGQPTLTLGLALDELEAMG